jgi:hypothetical protein
MQPIDDQKLIRKPALARRPSVVRVSAYINMTLPAYNCYVRALESGRYLIAAVKLTSGPRVVLFG